METIQVEIEHDRFDLTGNNNDENFQNRPMLEGNPNDPRDFHHVNWSLHRLKDAQTISDYRESLGEDVSFHKNVVVGKQDPWEKLKANDINKQMVQFQLPAKRIFG